MSFPKEFSFEELTYSATAMALSLDNTPDKEAVQNLEKLAQVLLIIRRAVGNLPVYVSSGYRSPEVNMAVGGSPTSSHCIGAAADFTCPGFGSPKELAQFISNLNFDFDQIIYEKSKRSEWVHLGIGPRMRKMVMTWDGRFHNGIV